MTPCAPSVFEVPQAAPHARCAAGRVLPHWLQPALQSGDGGPASGTAEAALRTATLAEPQAAAAIDLNGVVVACNTAFLQLWQVPQVLAERRRADDIAKHIASQLVERQRLRQRALELVSHPELARLDGFETLDGRLLERRATPYRLGAACVGTLVRWHALRRSDGEGAAADAGHGAGAANASPVLPAAGLADRPRLAAALRRALPRDELRLAFQPIVDLASGRVRKAEALLRWQHPELGLVGPADFIGLAEETGLIQPIGNWVFAEAARWVARWRASYDRGFQVSLNKSPLQFRAAVDHGSAWVERLRQLGLGGDSLVLEITEGMLLDTSARVQSTLAAYHAAGIEVAIDDFGTGYSSLAYLQKFDLDYLKIDRCFIAPLAPQSRELALVEAMIVMAHKLGLKVVAEGVETEQQRDLLRGMDCDFAQGHLFGRPVAGEEFEWLLVETMG